MEIIHQKVNTGNSKNIINRFSIKHPIKNNIKYNDISNTLICFFFNFIHHLLNIMILLLILEPYLAINPPTSLAISFFIETSITVALPPVAYIKATIADTVNAVPTLSIISENDIRLV